MPVVYSGLLFEDSRLLPSAVHITKNSTLLSEGVGTHRLVGASRVVPVQPLSTRLISESATRVLRVLRTPVSATCVVDNTPLAIAFLRFPRGSQPGRTLAA